MGLEAQVVLNPSNTEKCSKPDDYPSQNDKKNPPLRCIFTPTHRRLRCTANIKINKRNCS